MDEQIEKIEARIRELDDIIFHTSKNHIPTYRVTIGLDKVRLVKSFSCEPDRVQ